MDQPIISSALKGSCPLTCVLLCGQHTSSTRSCPPAKVIITSDQRRLHGSSQVWLALHLPLPSQPSHVVRNSPVPSPSEKISRLFVDLYFVKYTHFLSS